MKKTKKLTIILITLLILTSLFALFNTVEAGADFSDFIKNPAESIDNAEITKIQSIANPILTVIQVASIGVAVILVIMDGIKFITTVDNSEKANIKRRILYYIIGGVFIFIPTTIVNLIMSQSTDLIK